MLESICVERGLLFVEEFPVGKRGNKKVDGAVRDTYSSLGYWEAKDEYDDLQTEIKTKIAAGYPLNNTIFEDTNQAILWQNQKEVARFNLREDKEISKLLHTFFHHTEEDKEGFDAAVTLFVDKIPELARALMEKINHESSNATFQKAFGGFFAICKSALDPAIKEETVKEMLVQHLLTERLFRVVFNNPEWAARNVIAREIETVISALTSHSWSRSDFLKSLDPFYLAIENRARTLPDYSSKQGFLNTVYERFFQGYSPETADTMGIVYTPQEIVDWMCASVERVLANEWGKSLSTPGVKVLDPCTGTGNFIVNLLGRIKNIDLPQKYFHDLFANEIMLLPYYVASGNIEHEYFERLGEYRAFEGLCFADTLDMLHSAQHTMFAEANTERVDAEKAADITVIIGNPPYNVGQKNENDNNKNRVYKGIRGQKGVDDLIHDTYMKASKATNKNQLYDAYVRFFKWASERLKGNDGVICFVSNNSFIKKRVFDGMRKTLSEEFNHIWHLDLGGDVRSETGGNVFDIMVGVGITILARNHQSKEKFIRYYQASDLLDKKEKLAFLKESNDIDSIEWQTLNPNTKNAWLTEGLEDDFESFIPMGTKEAKAKFGHHLNKTIFNTYSMGVITNRDAWVFGFNRPHLESNMNRFIDFYNSEIDRWQKKNNNKIPFSSFVSNDDKLIKWCSALKASGKGGHKALKSPDYIVESLNRPFCKQFLYYNPQLIHRPGAFSKYGLKQKANRIIVVPGPGNRQPFGSILTDSIPTHDFAFEKTQCFPLYTYSDDGKSRYDNITKYALTEAQQLYGESVTREDIFYATYALLHHPAYRAKYAENLKLDLPRLPLFEKKLDFAEYARIGKLLGDLHVNFETAAPFALPLKDTTPNGKKFSARVEKMRFSKDKSTLVVNESITLCGFTPQMFEYKLGNRSALDWVVECYRVKTDKRSGLVSDPNRQDEPRFILDLIGKVATVSLETQRLIGELPEWISTKE